MLAPLDFGARQVFHLLAIEPGHVRAVAPDDAGQGRLQPPQAPGAAQYLLDAPIQCGIGLRFLALVMFRGVRIDSAEAEHGGHDVVSAGMRRAGRGRHIQVAGRVDHHVTQNRLRAALAFTDHPAHGAVFDQRVREPGMQAQIDAGLLHHVERHAFPAIGVEGGGKTDGVRLRMGMEIEGAVAVPALACGCFVTPFVLARIERELHRRQAFDHGLAGAAHRDFVQVVVPHVVEHQHHATGGEATEVVVTLQQGDAGTIARGGKRRGKPGRAAAHHDHIGTRRDRDITRGLAHASVRFLHKSPPS